MLLIWKATVDAVRWGGGLFVAIEIVASVSVGLGAWVCVLVVSVWCLVYVVHSSEFLDLYLLVKICSIDLEG